MSSIVLYRKENQNLGVVKFLNATLNAVKIREADGYELSKALSHWITETSLALAIKDPISNFNKKDVIEMIVTEYKSISVDELYYAFKLERYGKLKPITKGEPQITKHFQMFNAEYVSTVLRKYKIWKQKQMIEHNIHKKSVDPPSQTETEKKYWINRGVTSCLGYFEKHRHVETGKIFVYEILYDDGYLSKELDFKREMYAEAQEALRFEYADKKATSRQQKIDYKNIISGIEQKANEKVIAKAKELILNRFFRNLTSEKKELQEFKERYKY